MKSIKIISLCVSIILAITLFGSITALAYVTPDPNTGYTEDEVWMKNSVPLKDYAYSMAIVGDTQFVTDYYPDKLACIYDWIIANKNIKNIRFVVGLGDITNLILEPGDVRKYNEWKVAVKQLKKMNGVIPYSLIRGNHDSIDTYNMFVTQADFGENVTGAMDNTMRNTYYKFSVGNIKYLIIGLDYEASDEMLAWAANVIESNPDHNVIVTTHVYLQESGIRYKQAYTGDKIGTKNDAEAIWDKLISKHENIVMVLCGHSPSDWVVVRNSVGDNGNYVKEILIDPQNIDRDQGASGMVCMFYFSEDGSNIQVEYYSTVKDRYYLPRNNGFEFKVNVIGANDEADPPSDDTDETDSQLDTTGSDKHLIDDDVAITIIISITFVIIASLLAIAFIPAKNKKE